MSQSPPNSRGPLQQGTGESGFAMLGGGGGAVLAVTMVRRIREDRPAYEPEPGSLTAPSLVTAVDGLVAVPLCFPLQRVFTLPSPSPAAFARSFPVVVAAPSG